MLRAQLRMKLEQSVFWTDTTSVLIYIMNEKNPENPEFKSEATVNVT